MSVPIEVTVTGYQRGTGPVVPYNGTDGLQFYANAHGVPSRRVVI